MVSRSYNSGFTSGVTPSGLWRAEVVAVYGNLLSIKIPRLGLSNVYENVSFIGYLPAVGDRVWAAFVEGSSSTPVVLAGANDTESDISEIVAGLGLSGGGSAGVVTLTFEPDELVSVAPAYNDNIVISDYSDDGNPAVSDVLSVIDLPNTAVIAVGEPMGHENRADSQISFVDGSRIFSISPVDSSYVVWCRGVRFEKSDVASVTIPDITGLYYIFFDTDGNLGFSSSYFTWDEQCPTAYVYWNAATGKAEFFADERHGIVLDWQTHEYLHRTRGAAIANGFDADNFDVATRDGDTDDQAQLDIGDGTFFDEDLEVNIRHSDTPESNSFFEQVLQGPALLPVFYRYGTGFVSDTPTPFPVKQGVSHPVYNSVSGGLWATTELSANSYGVQWIVASNQVTYPVLSIMGQSEYANVGQAEQVSWSDMDIEGLPILELRPLYKIIFRATGSNTPNCYFAQISDYRTVLSSATSIAAAVVDHGNLSGLDDDDHVHYLLADGSRSADEFDIVGSLSVDSDTLVVDSSTSRVGIGVSAPDDLLHISGDSASILVEASTGTPASLLLEEASGVAWALSNDAGADNVLAFYNTANGGVGELSVSGDLLIEGEFTANAGITVVSGTAVSLTDGSASAPSIIFSSDVTTGLYKFGPDSVGVAVDGAAGLAVSSNGVSTVAGSAASPSVSFISDTNTGLYSEAADTLNFSTGGTNRLTLSTTNITSGLNVRVPAGSVSTPSLSFSNDTNTGMYSKSSDQMAITCGGTEAVAFEYQGIRYTGATIGGGTASRIGFRWVSPNVKVTVDNVTALTISTTSDRRLKSNIQMYTSGVDVIRSLNPIMYNPCDFDILDNGGLTFSAPDLSQSIVGLIADEVEGIAPWAVDGEATSSTLQSVNYAALVTPLVAAAQSLLDTVDMLQDQIDSVITRLDAAGI